MAKSQSFAWTAPLIIETGANPIMVQFLLKELHYHINAQRQLAQAFYERFLQLPPPCAGVRSGNSLLFALGLAALGYRFVGFGRFGGF